MLFCAIVLVFFIVSPGNPAAEEESTTDVSECDSTVEHETDISSESVFTTDVTTTKKQVETTRELRTRKVSTETATVAKESVAANTAPHASNMGLYTEDELDLFARLIYAEAGSTWLSDELQLMVGSVVLNRVASPLFPNTIRGVIYQSGQYQPTWSGSINNTPDSRTINNARHLLENGSILPAGVVGQNSVATGEIYTVYHDSILGSVYFCYL